MTTGDASYCLLETGSEVDPLAEEKLPINRRGVLEIPPSFLWLQWPLG